MPVERVEVVGRPIPFENEFPVRYTTGGETEHAFVRVVTTDGLVGYGEGTALPWFTGETTTTMISVVENEIAPAIEGGTVDAAAAELEDLIGYLPDQPGAIAGVDAALLDLRAKRIGEPANVLLGPRRRDSIPIVYTIPVVDVDRAVDRLQAAADRGFRRFKFKAAGDIDADTYRLNRLLDALPEGATARIDSNGAWQEFKTARRAVASLDRTDRIEYLEQPVEVGYTEDMKRLREVTGIPVHADESVHYPADVVRLGRDAAIDGLHVTFAKSGPIATTETVARVATEMEMTVTVASALGCSVDAAANLHLAATLPEIAPCEIGGAAYLEHDPVDEHIPRQPEMPVPTEPGLGVEPDPDLFD